MRGLTVSLLACAAAFGAGLDPKTRAEDYAHSVKLPGGGALGVEFHGRGLPDAKGGVFLGWHIVLEVAYYPAQGETVNLRGGQFLLKIDKMKIGIQPETPGMVAASAKYSGWEQQRGLQVEGAAGPIVYGPGGGRRRFPSGPAEPEPTSRRVPQVGEQKPDPQELEAAAILDLALTEGETSQVVAGYLYYRWGGNLKKIKKLTLEFTGPGGPATFEIPMK